jgi:hypothetical protein
MAAYSSTQRAPPTYQQMYYPPFPGAPAEEDAPPNQGPPVYENQQEQQAHPHAHHPLPLGAFPPHAPFAAPPPEHLGNAQSVRRPPIAAQPPPHGGTRLQFINLNTNGTSVTQAGPSSSKRLREAATLARETEIHAEDAEAEAGANGGDDQDGEEEAEDGLEENNTPPEGFYYLAPPPISTYDTADEAIEAMHSWNKDHGFDVSKQKPMKNKAGELYKYLYRCTRHGRLDNNRKLTDETRKRKRKSGKTGCPMGLYVKAIEPQNPSGRWKISYQQNGRSKFHNHEASSAQELTGHRRRHRTEEMKMLIRQQRAAGMDATQTLAYIKERLPEALVTRQDILNYRRTDPGPLQDNTNYTDKPYILCISFLQDFENDVPFGQSLLQKLRTKIPVSVCTKVEQLSKHFEKNAPKVVLVADSALSYPAYRLQLARLVVYNQDGGTIVFMGHFSDTPRDYINDMFLHHWNLEWEAGGDASRQATYQLNEKLEAGGTGGRYTVVARNFAPGTDVRGVEALLALGPTAAGSLVSCRLYSQQPIVVAELVFASHEDAEGVINTFSGKSVNVGRIATAEGKELEFALRTPAPMGTSDLAPTCYIKANYLTKVAPEHSVYQYAYTSDLYGQWGPPMVQQNQSAAAAVYAKVGKGYLGYVGLVDYDENYLKMVAAMCHF